MLASDLSKVFTWHRFWPLIGQMCPDILVRREGGGSVALQDKSNFKCPTQEMSTKTFISHKCFNKYVRSIRQGKNLSRVNKAGIIHDFSFAFFSMYKLYKKDTSPLCLQASNINTQRFSNFFPISRSAVWRIFNWSRLIYGPKIIQLYSSSVIVVCHICNFLSVKINARCSQKLNLQILQNLKKGKFKGPFVIIKISNLSFSQ